MYKKEEKGDYCNEDRATPRLDLLCTIHHVKYLTYLDRYSSSNAANLLQISNACSPSAAYVPILTNTQSFCEPNFTPKSFIMSSAFVPGSQQRYLRACMVCSIVQTHAVSSPHSPRSHPCLEPCPFSALGWSFY